MEGKLHPALFQLCSSSMRDVAVELSCIWLLTSCVFTLCSHHRNAREPRLSRFNIYIDIAKLSDDLTVTVACLSHSNIVSGYT